MESRTKVVFYFKYDGDTTPRTKELNLDQDFPICREDNVDEKVLERLNAAILEIGRYLCGYPTFISFSLESAKKLLHT